MNRGRCYKPLPLRPRFQASRDTEGPSLWLPLATEGCLRTYVDQSFTWPQLYTDLLLIFQTTYFFPPEALNYHLRMSMAYPAFCKISPESKLQTPQPFPLLHLRSVKSYFPLLCSDLRSHLLSNLFLWKLKASGCHLTTLVPLASPVSPPGPLGRGILCPLVTAILCPVCSIKLHFTLRCLRKSTKEPSTSTRNLATTCRQLTSHPLTERDI